MEDQCDRLMGSLEEARRTINALTAEKDHYKEFWQAMNTYHSVMSRFQVPTVTATHLSFPYNTPSQAAQNPFMGAGFPMYNNQALPTIGSGPLFQSHEQESMGQSSSLPLQSQQTQITGAAAINNPPLPVHATPPSAIAQPQDVSPNQNVLQRTQATPPSTPKVFETPKKEASKPIDSYFSKSPANLGNVKETAEIPAGAETTTTRQWTAQNNSENPCAAGPMTTNMQDGLDETGRMGNDENDHHWLK